ncbi:hypothetical protein HC251_10345 [Iamia sp. SCSIO 61187]|uniref:hypothetical protein n=1 Tax=Iamia sp. SCSIO 61187 TaxID=2722752 RepID=UPI001C6335D9|nr:hypothetical protein [Iamia sp. SCSIO 61187]QYG92789.1 hypothetical protein HC251_10345 [Iamia sp. SCSIO 61187]
MIVGARLARALVAGVALVVALGVAAGPAGAQAAPGGPRAQAGLSCVTGEGEVATSAVLVVVAFPSGTFTRCVSPGGSGLDVLRAAGLALEVQSFGAKGGAVCGITDPNGTFVGCADGPDCLRCPATEGGSRYWGYYRCYAYSHLGAGSTTPAGGTVEAWRFAGGGGWGGSRPAECDDGVAEPAPTVPPAPPPGGGGPPGGGSSGGGSPGGGGGGAAPGDGATGGGAPAAPDGAAGPGATAGPEAPGSTAPPTTTADASSTTTTTDEAGADAATDEDDAEAAEARDGDRRDQAWEPTEGGDERADGVPASARSDAGGGAPVVPLVVTALVVAGVAALALRARRHRADRPPTPA